ncbi:hypothetical protein ACCAA_790001 [Candidatus Accumulibacter aalborgensis]|uniref:Uncharacterized protein n=1 Tax=Candidatus Accumulibacter aalborgensis TaxID=1860102 RepID=A0A1A8Y0G0_9PROT|nr:hypothetical protein ACCAA_790001 [Candidatus Accumulibacter aalborgensis]
MRQGCARAVRVYREADLGDNSGFRAVGSRPSARAGHGNGGYPSEYQDSLSGNGPA